MQKKIFDARSLWLQDWHVAKKNEISQSMLGDKEKELEALEEKFKHILDQPVTLRDYNWQNGLQYGSPNSIENIEALLRHSVDLEPDTFLEESTKQR